MKLIVEDYLQQLGERPELENLVVQLLEKMGLEVYSVPQQGVRQFGVDVAAVGIWPGTTYEAVHLLTIKAGDITRKNWDSGGLEDVRPSLNEIEDVYLAQRIRPQDLGKPVHVYICCGGRVLQGPDVNVDAFITGMTNRHKDDNLQVSVLDGSQLTSFLLEFFFDERTFVSGDQRLLKRCLATLDEPDLVERYYRELLSSILKENDNSGNPLPKSIRMDCVGRLLLCLGILVQHALEAKLLEGAYRTLERSIVFLFGYLELDLSIKKPAERPLKQIFAAISLYDHIGFSYLEKLETLATTPYLFTLAVGGNEVDVNLCFYNTLARLAEYGLFLISHYKNVKDVGFFIGHEDFEKEFCNRIRRVANCICGLINNNAVSRQPVNDSQHYAIMATLLFLVGVNRDDSAHNWALSMLDGINNRFLVNKGYPACSFSYEELIEHVEVALPEEKRQQALHSSELYAYLALVAFLYKWDDVYAAVRNLVQEHLPNTNLQLWFMAEEDMNNLCKLCGVNGRQLCNLNINDKEQFAQIVQLESDYSKPQMTYMSFVFPSFFFVACRLNNVPIPASVWLNCDSNVSANGPALDPACGSRSA